MNIGTRLVILNSHLIIGDLIKAPNQIKIETNGRIWNRVEVARHNGAVGIIGFRNRISNTVRRIRIGSKEIINQLQKN